MCLSRARTDTCTVYLIWLSDKIRFIFHIIDKQSPLFCYAVQIAGRVTAVGMKEGMQAATFDAAPLSQMPGFYSPIGPDNLHVLIKQTHHSGQGIHYGFPVRCGVLNL